jgi:protein involved in polysaccharide export with SLBB domain
MECHPRELEMITLPPYVIDIPDILVINAVRLIPRGPYRIEPLDVLLLQVAGALPREPLDGLFTVGPEGRIDLGTRYGQVMVANMTLEEARVAIEEHLKPDLKTPRVSLGLAQSRGYQQIRGEHIVRPDGTVSLGVYGSVSVVGMTLDQARAAIETHLAQFFFMPEVSVDVFAFNSKFYYVIFDGGGYGQEVVRLPFTGNETVLDAISHPQISGLPAFSSTKHIWIARPNPVTKTCDQILPVNWQSITQGGYQGTNFQLLPGDRIYVKADTMVAFDNFVTKVISPFERMFGITLLGSETVRSLGASHSTLGSSGGP